MNLKSFVLSWDTAVALLTALVLASMIPERVNNSLAKDIYGVGITTLSIVFSMFFAALAMIMSSGDNDFVYFMEHPDGGYTELLSLFRFTLCSLFVALTLSIVFYGVTSWLITSHGVEKQSFQNKWFLVGFSSVSVYALVATLLSSVDAIRYAELRVKYLRLTNAKEDRHEIRQS